MSCYFSRFRVFTQESLGLQPQGKHLEMMLTKYITGTVTKLEDHKILGAFYEANTKEPITSKRHPPLT
jgi:hypothetical protein